MKILIISEEKILKNVFQKVLSSFLENINVLTSNHDEALSVFLDEDPTHILVCDYTENFQQNLGGRTFKEIKNASVHDEKIFRIGFSNFEYPDYIKMPFEISELLRKINI